MNEGKKSGQRIVEGEYDRWYLKVFEYVAMYL